MSNLLGELTVLPLTHNWIKREKEGREKGEKKSRGRRGDREKEREKGWLLPKYISWLWA